MNRLLVTLLSVFLLANSASVQAEDTSYIKNARNAIGAEFNATVKAIKTYLKSSDEDIKVDEEDITTAKSDIVNLKSASAVGENNPTVLDHGDANLPSCTSSTSGYSNEATCRSVHDLVWAGNKWTWKKPNPKADCTPSSGEVKVSDGKGGFTCKQNGTYTSTTDGYGPCIEPAGLKYSQSVCMFKNAVNGKRYQVDASNCGAAAAQTSQVCGADWAITSYAACRSGDVQDAIYQCQDRATHRNVSSSKCKKTRPTSTKPCIFYTYSWLTSSYGACQSDSKQYRTSVCKQTPGNRTVSDSNCGTKPALTKACVFYTYSWLTSSYGACQPDNKNYRTAICKQTPGNKTVSDANCGTKPSLTQACAYGCPAKRFSVSRRMNDVYGDPTTRRCTFNMPKGVEGATQTKSEFGVCAETSAGDATCTGNFTCRNGVWSMNNWSFACGVANFTYAWSAGAYGACQPDSKQYRPVVCKMNPGNATTSNSRCKGTKPAASRGCTRVPDCAAKTYYEATGRYPGYTGNCSGNLSAGFNGDTRTSHGDALCTKRNYESYDMNCTATFTCSGNSWVKTSVSGGCGGPNPKTYTWATSSYGSCQSDSRQYRSSICKENPGNKTVSDINCGNKPAASKSCTYYTGSWVRGSYGSCSVSGACGQTGVRSASYSCQGGPCSGGRPANATISCSTSACAVGRWVMNSYGSCSVSGACGQTGTKSASYSCVGGTCSTAKPRNSVISCSTAACPPAGRWILSGYGSCSVTGCGQTGFKRGVYKCVGGLCSGSAPNSTITCRTSACAPAGRWVLGSYGSCSVSACGQTGVRTATYTCQGGRCSTSRPANRTQSCSTSACASGRWVRYGSSIVDYAEGVGRYYDWDRNRPEAPDPPAPPTATAREGGRCISIGAIEPVKYRWRLEDDCNQAGECSSEWELRETTAKCQ